MSPARAIGRFSIEAEAASGAAGTVYQARDPQTGDRVALKVIRGLSASDAARFAREAKILARIRHPGVVRYIDQGYTDEGNAYLVMEWLDGEDVRSRLLRAGLSIHESVTLGLRVAEALAAFHAQGLVHRDLKPANIFLPGGRVSDAKIIDLGLVRSEWASAEVTVTGMVVGTPSYMAPEQARGERGIDARADLFSLGCVLYKCLTGRSPFEGISVLAVLTKVLLEEAPLVRGLRPEVPLPLEALVMRLLQKEPSLRPADAMEVAQALAALSPMDGLGERVEPAPQSYVLSGLTTGEQRVSAVLLVGAGGSGALPADETLPSAAKAAPETDLGPLVETYGGQLDTLLDGTRVITLASAGVATDQAAQAARCALALRALVPGAPMTIATGRGELGRRQTTGDAIERAALLLAGRAAAAPGIAIDEATAALLDPRFEVESGDGGLRLVGLHAGAPLARTLLGRATPMVGRDWELGSIEDLFRACVEEREGRSVLVTGAAGMGKSRLAGEAVRALRARFPDIEVWWGRGDPLRSGSALGLLGQVIRSAAEVREADPPESRRRRFTERVAGWVGARQAERVAELLGEIAGVPFPDEHSPALHAARQEPRLMSEQVAAAWEAVIAGAPRPVLMVLEDLHWADTATVRHVGAALASQERRPWMVLALARPEVHDVFPRLWEGRDLQEIRLAPLPRRACERLARGALGAEFDAATVQRIAAQSDGNAFYLEELIRTVADATVGAGGLPETVLAMVQARLEGLDPGTRRVLRAASIFGVVFWEGAVAALLGGSVPQADWVKLLVDRELVTVRDESRFADERELVFRNALLREGAYATLTEGDRILGHALAGAWLVRQGESDAMALAQHAELAMDEARASRFYLAAAGQALRAADLEGTIARAERAIAQTPDAATRVQCLSLLCEAHAWRDDWGRAGDYADQVTGLAAPGSEPWIRAMGNKQTAAMVLGRVDELVGAIMSLTTVEAEPGTATALAQALTVTVFLLCFGARLPMAVALVARLGAIVEADDTPAPLALAPLSIARSWAAAWAGGDPWAALGHTRAARAHAEAARHARDARVAQIFAGLWHWSLGQLAEAEAELRAVEPAGAADLMSATSSLYLTIVLVERGALDEARELAQRRLEIGQARVTSDGVLREAEGRWLLGEVAARAGDLEAAERELGASLAPLLVSALAWQLAAARLVEVRLARGRVPEALALARELHAAFVAAGGPGLRGTLVQLVHAEALDAAGEPDAARAALREARDDLQAKAARIDDKAARARFLSVMPENVRVLAWAREWLGE